MIISWIFRVKTTAMVHMLSPFSMFTFFNFNLIDKFENH